MGRSKLALDKLIQITKSNGKTEEKTKEEPTQEEKTGSKTQKG